MTKDSGLPALPDFLTINMANPTTDYGMALSFLDHAVREILLPKYDITVTLTALLTAAVLLAMQTGNDDAFKQGLHQILKNYDGMKARNEVANQGGGEA